MKTGVKKALKKILSAVLASAMVISSAAPSIGAQAEESFPDISAVVSRLEDGETVEAKDIEFDAGGDVDIEKEGISYDAGKVTVKMKGAQDSSGASYRNDRPGTYTAVYNCTPKSGSPSYSVRRKITVREVRTTSLTSQAERGEAPSQDEASNEETSQEDDEADPEDKALQEADEKSSPQGGSSEETASPAEEDEEGNAPEEGREEEKEEEKTTEENTEEAPEASKEEEEVETGEETEEISEEAEEYAEELALLNAIPQQLGNVTCGRDGITPLPLPSKYVNHTRTWWVTHKGVKYYAVCARASATGPVNPSNPTSSTASIRYNRLTPEVIDGLAAWMKKTETGDTIPITKGLGSNAELAKAVMVSMFVRADFWEETFDTFVLSYAAAHLLASDLLFGDDDGCSKKDPMYDVVFRQMKTKVQEWAAQPENRALLDASPAYIGYLWNGGSGGNRQPLMWVETPGVIEIRKRAVDDEENEITDVDLTGTVYRLYKDEACTQPAVDSYGNEAVFTCNADGTANKVIIDFGTYYLKETAAAKGLALDEDVYECVLKRDTSFGNGLNHLTKKVVDHPDSSRMGALVIRKVDSETVSAQGGASLEGAVYEIVVNSEDGVEDAETYYSKGDVYAELTTDAEGSAELAVIPAGEYIIREKKPSKGYKLSGENVAFSIEDNQTTYLTEGSALKEDVIKAPFRFKKLNSNAENMADILFEVTCKESGKTWTVRTGKDGTYDSSRDADKTRRMLPYGTYTLTELECDANKGYALSSPVTFTVSGETVIDLGTFVNYKEPSAETELTASDGSHNARPRKDLELTDTVSISDFYDYVGKKITVKGILVDKETKEQYAEVETAVTLAAPSGDIEMTFTLDGTGLGGRAVVAFEYVLDEKGEEIAKHEDLEDEDQTVWFPSFGTRAKAAATGDNVMPSEGTITIDDEVEFHALTEGGSYTVRGILYDAAKKAPFTVGGKEVTSSASFTAGEGGDGTVTVRFTFEAPEGFEGTTLVVFESLYDAAGELVAEHKNISDKDQTVYAPKVRTNATDPQTKDHIGRTAETTTLTDRVTYTNLVAGREYTVTGTLYNKATGEAVLAGGKQITAEKTFKAKAKNGTVDLEFTFDSSILAGQSVVAFETLYHKGIEVAAHADINDKDQTVSFPEVRTTALDKGTGSHYGSLLDEKTIITDAVRMEGLVPDQEYSLKAVLMDRSTGAPLAGGVYTKELTFKADAESMTLNVEFEVRTGDIAGKAVVAFETLYHKGIDVCAHTDLSDEEQTVTYPSVKTTAVDASTKDHVGRAAEDAVVQDLVEYTGLEPGKEYVLTGTLYDKATGKALKGGDGNVITATKKFTPDKADGSVLITFQVDGRLLGGKSVVAFETISYEGREIAVHADLEDKGQTVHYPEIGTKASDIMTGDSVGTSDRETATITDIVSYKDLIPGETYTVKGKLMVKSTGEALVADGSEVRVEKTFTPEKADGTVAMTFTFDAGALKGETAVVFESLEHKGIEVAAHADIEDKDQSITYPGIHTSASDVHTKDHVGLVSMLKELFGMPKTTDVVDTVTYEGLIAGKVYTISGTLMEKESGEPVLDSRGEEITASKTLTADASEGTIDLVFTVESELLAGKTAVVYEYLIYGDVVVAVHADIEDRDQSVSYPDIATSAKDRQTEDHVGTCSEEAVIIDTIEMTGLVAGEEYTVKGSLHDKESGDVITLKDGSTVVEMTFTAEGESGSVDMEFIIDSSIFKGKAVVVFEDLYHKGVKIAVHADLESEDQTVHYPEVKTSASDKMTGDGVGRLGEEVTIIDTVTYHDLIPGKEYTVSGQLMNKATGEPILDGSGNAVVSEETVFTAETADGSVDIAFTLDSSLLAGESAVAFEHLYYRGIEVAAHADLTDKDQTVDYPEIGTEAVDGRTGAHTGEVTGSAILEDTVYYRNLVPGKSYVVEGRLVLKSTGEETGAAASAAFVPDKAEGSVVLTFEFDSSAYAGDTVVAFETLLHNDVEIAVHADLGDEAQSVHYPDVTTDAKDGDTKKHVGALSETATVVDVVTYHNLIIGKEYTVSGVLMDQETGEPLPDENGNEITAETTFTAEKADGTAELIYTLDSTLLSGKTVVVFEDLYHEDVKVAFHADIEDEEQTVHYPAVRTMASDDQTGTQTGTADEEVSVTDMVWYENLVPGSYIAYGSVVSRETGEAAVDADGNEITAVVPFANTEMNGSVPVTFTFNATGFDASTVVVFQSIYAGTDDLDGKGVLVAEHKDMEDEAEMIFYPGVETEASDGLTKNHTGIVSEEATVVDVVTYHNLIPGKEYTVSGVLMNKDTGEPVLDSEGNEITASSTFTAEEAEGTTELVYTLDSTLLSGKTVVVFEDLFHEGVRVAFHADIEDEDQSVHYPEIGTKASIDGEKSAQAGGTITLDDTVEYRNLVPGMEYTIVGVLMDRDAKNVLKVGGKDVTSKVTFTPESADGTVTVTFTFRASGLGGKTLVAFEYLYSNDELVTSHARLSDEAQTVKLTTPPSPPKTGDESNMILWGILAAAALAGGFAVILWKKKRTR